MKPKPPLTPPALRLGLTAVFAAALLFRVLPIRAQEVHLKFNVVGPGAIVTCCPEPNQAGQGYLLVAQPLPNARFVQWDDGSTGVERYLLLNTNQTEFTAYFEDVADVPYLVQHGLQAIDPSQRGAAEFFQDGTRLRLSFVLPGRHGYRVLGSTNLLTTLFSTVPFASEPASAATLVENYGEAGPVSVWIDATNAQGYFKIVLDNQLTLPAIYFAQATIVHPGDAVMLYGDNLSGTVQAFAGAASVTATAVDSHSVRVIAPSTPGLYPFSVRINGATALGAVTIRVSTNSADFVTLDNIAGYEVTAGGVCELTGSGFGPGIEAFLDGKPIQIAAIAESRNALVVRIPAGITGNHSIALVRNGALSTAVTINITAGQYTYTPAAPEGALVYTWAPSKPGTYTYAPAAPEGVLVYTWARSQPNSYSFTAAARQGVLVYTWSPSKPGTYSYFPATIRGVLVKAP